MCSGGISDFDANVRVVTRYIFFVTDPMPGVITNSVLIQFNDLINNQKIFNIQCLIQYSMNHSMFNEYSISNIVY